MQGKAAGTSEVSLHPLDKADRPGAVSLGRIALGKQFSGDLVGTGNGTMLTAMTTAQCSRASYVVIDRVTRAFDGRAGGLVPQHTRTMDRGAERLLVAVVPDSGTEQLTGPTGKLAINIVEGKHFHDLDYKLPD